MKWRNISWIAQILKYFKQLCIPVCGLPFENAGLPTADYKPFPFGKFLLGGGGDWGARDSYGERASLHSPPWLRHREKHNYTMFYALFNI